MSTTIGPLLPDCGARQLVNHKRILPQIVVVIAAVLGIVIYRVITVSTFAALGWAPIRNNSQVATTATAVCINFCVIMLLNVVSVPPQQQGALQGKKAPRHGGCCVVQVVVKTRLTAALLLQLYEKVAVFLTNLGKSSHCDLGPRFHCGVLYWETSHDQLELVHSLPDPLNDGLNES